jgi:TetR/AcrR family transcriptional regulator, transcriptional repressor for nem operon
MAPGARIESVRVGTVLWEQSMGQSTRGAETKLRIIRAAADLFHKQGYRATSPDQIIKASATGKGQFYHYFKNKEGLVHEVLQNYLDAVKTGTGRLSYDIESWQDLEQWFHGQIELQKGFRMARGCPFGTIGNEVTANDELIRQDLSLIFEVIKGKLAAFFIKEKANRRLSAEANEGQMADFCIAAIQGAMFLGKIQRDSRPVEMVVREALASLNRYVVGSA